MHRHGSASTSLTRVVAQVQDVAVHAQALALQNGSRQVAAGLAAEVVQAQIAHQRAPGAAQLHLLCPIALCQPATCSLY